MSAQLLAVFRPQGLTQTRMASNAARVVRRPQWLHRDGGKPSRENRPHPAGNPILVEICIGLEINGYPPRPCSDPRVREIALMPGYTFIREGLNRPTVGLLVITQIRRGHCQQWG
jgi:hypothetical protein